MQIESAREIHPLTFNRRHHNEKSNCYPRLLRTVCAAGVRADAFHVYETNRNDHRTNKVTGKIITTTAEGAAANYQPVKTLVVREDRSNKPGSYVLNGPGHIVDKTGALVQSAVRPGARVRVYYTNAGDQRMIDHVVVLD
jgi:hypothetical protein